MAFSPPLARGLAPAKASRAASSEAPRAAPRAAPLAAPRAALFLPCPEATAVCGALWALTRQRRAALSPRLRRRARQGELEQGGGQDWEQRLRSLLLTGEKQPLWFRTTDTVLTASAAACFILSTIETQRGTALVLRGMEDVINVFFTMGFFLLFWANDFRPGWLLQPSSFLDLASCLPVVSIFLRPAGDDSAAYAQMLQVFRFLRLLRETRLITKSDRSDIPVGAELTVLAIGFAGLITVSATVLFIYERGNNGSVISILDALFYMANIFTARPAPFSPTTSLGKVVTILALSMALVGIPFFVAEVTAVAMDSVGVGPGKNKGKDAKASAAESTPAGLTFWGDCLLAVDGLEEAGRLEVGEAAELRGLCYSQQHALAVVMTAYRNGPTERLATRLRECLRYCQAGAESAEARRLEASH